MSNAAEETRQNIFTRGLPSLPNPVLNQSSHSKLLFNRFQQAGQQSATVNPLLNPTVLSQYQQLRLNQQRLNQYSNRLYQQKKMEQESLQRIQQRLLVDQMIRQQAIANMVSSTLLCSIFNVLF